MKKVVLEEASSSKKSPWALAAANIRRELSAKFPGVRFRVTSESYAGGSSVSVHWVDGPTRAEVQSVVEKYQYGSFDPMRDLYEYRSDHDARYGSVKYVAASRRYSAEAIAKTAESLSIPYTVEGEGPSRRVVPENWEDQALLDARLATRSFLEESEVTA